MPLQKTPLPSHSIFTKTLSYLRNLFRKDTEAKTFVCGTALKDGYRRKQAEAKKFAALSEQNNKIHLGVYGLYINNKNEILVIKKSRGPYSGLYDLPGGKLEFMETLEQCLKRELSEEIGASELNKMEFLSVNEYQCRYQKDNGAFKDFHHVGLYYKVDINIANLKTGADGHDSNGALFVPLSSLTASNTAPIALPMIKLISL